MREPPRNEANFKGTQFVNHGFDLARASGGCRPRPPGRVGHGEQQMSDGRLESGVRFVHDAMLRAWRLRLGLALKSVDKSGNIER